MHPEPCRLADKPEDYAHFNLERRQIQQWEDGIRVDTGAPNLEWWYCDVDLDDGTGLAVLFCTKDGTRPNQPLQPQLEIDLTKPDGTRLVRSWYPKPEEFSASSDRMLLLSGRHEQPVSAAELLQAITRGPRPTPVEGGDSRRS